MLCVGVWITMWRGLIVVTVAVESSSVGRRRGGELCLVATAWATSGSTPALPHACHIYRHCVPVHGTDEGSATVTSLPWHNIMD